MPGTGGNQKRLARAAMEAPARASLALAATAAATEQEGGGRGHLTRTLRAAAAAAAAKDEVAAARALTAVAAGRLQVTSGDRCSRRWAAAAGCCGGKQQCHDLQHSQEPGAQLWLRSNEALLDKAA